MRLIYLTAKKYPGNTADHHYIYNLAKAFGDKLGERFTFVVWNTKKDILQDISVVNVYTPYFIKRTVAFFFFIPRYWFLKLRKEREHVVFFSNDFNLLVVLIIWKRLFNLPYIIVSDWHLLTNTWKDKFIARHSNCSITTSKKLENAIYKLAKRPCTQTIYGGVAFEKYKRDINIIKLREELNLPKDKILIGYVGFFTTMGMEKGISTMIDALQYLPHNNTMVFVGGKKHEIEKYQTYASSKKVLDKCIFIPVQLFDKVVQYEQAMNVLVIPYPDKPHFRKYGFPMKVYEYMASGVPIVYSKLKLSEEVLSDCAFNFTPDDSLELANIISYIHKSLDEVNTKTSLAVEKSKEYSWEVKAMYLLKIFDILLHNMLNIPDIAVRYILFQRTEYLIYQNTWWLNKIIIRIPFLTYHHMVSFEARILRNRVKRLFSKDMLREYNSIKDFLPENVEKILDIGSGVAGIDCMMNRHYKEKNISADFYLLDRTEMDKKVFYGIKEKASFYNSFVVSKLLMTKNGVKAENIHTQEATHDNKINFNVKFDLVTSFISWGFHYPVSIYIDQVYNLLNTGGVLIIDVRKDSGGKELLESKFGNIEVIAERQKHERIVVHKK